ncbi:MAG: hypothetical protein GPJ54_04175 [Candidatus Heimdallarchaeota archaeon]|nr:hypothetical protein [Candidatus Heimdallarchaeota archaeon]
MKFDRAKFRRIMKIILAVFIIIILIYNVFYIIIIPNRVKISSIESSAASLKVLTYNVENGFTDSILQKLIQSEADIIGLQEAFSFYHEGSYQQLNEVANLLAMNYSVPNDNYIAKYGLVILTKHKISSVSEISYQHQQGAFPRSLLIAQIETPNGKINVMNTHLSFPSMVSSRYHQIEEIIQNMEKASPTLLLGDFNTPASLLDPSYWLLSSEFSDGYIAAGGNVYTGRTWNKDTAILRVDYIWLSEHWDVIEESYKFYEDNDSDHRGFSLEISLS